MSLRPLKTVDRRGDWRARLPFWDRETFQSYTIAPTGQSGDAVASFAVFRHTDGCDHERWLRDYGCGRHCPRQPVLNVFTDDGTGYLRLAADGISALLSVPQPIIAELPRGLYLASLAAAYGDGSVIDFGADFVTVEGPQLSTSWHGLQMSGGRQGVGNRGAVNDFFPYSIPILPGAVGNEVMAAVLRNRLDASPDAPVVAPLAPYPGDEGAMAAGGYQPAGSDAAVNSLVRDQTQTGLT